VLCRTR